MDGQLLLPLVPPPASLPSHFPHSDDSLIPTPTQPPQRRNVQSNGNRDSGGAVLEKRQSVVTVTSSQVATSTSTASTATKIPIAPIVGGIIAGVIVVVLVGGLWYWCHMKGVKEDQERRERKAARAARAAAVAAGKPPGALSTRVKSDQSVNSLASSRKMGGEKMIPLGGLGAAAGGGGHSRGPSGQSAHSVPYGNGPGYGQQQQGQYGNHAGGYDQNGQPIGVYTDPSSPSGGSSSGSSSKSEKNRRPRHQNSASTTSSLSDPPTSADPLRRYQPAKPSPLAAGAVRAAPKAGDDGPKWGQGPFRSKSEDDYHLAQQQQQQLAYPQSQGHASDAQDHRKTMMSDASDYGGASSAYDGHPTGGAYNGNAGLAPPIEEEVLAADGSRGRSGEWGVAYSNQPQSGGYGQPNHFVAEPTTTQPQRSNYNYAASSPPRSAGAHEDQYGYHQYQQDMPPSSVPDPYNGYGGGGQTGGRQAVDPYAYAGGGGNGANTSGGYGNRI